MCVIEFVSCEFICTRIFVYECYSTFISISIRSHSMCVKNQPQPHVIVFVPPLYLCALCTHSAHRAMCECKAKTYVYTKISELHTQTHTYTHTQTLHGARSSVIWHITRIRSTCEHRVAIVFRGPIDVCTRARSSCYCIALHLYGTHCDVDVACTTIHHARSIIFRYFSLRHNRLLLAQRNGLFWKPSIKCVLCFDCVLCVECF